MCWNVNGGKSHFHLIFSWSLYTGGVNLTLMNSHLNNVDCHKMMIEEGHSVPASVSLCRFLTCCYIA